jgi:hypothetical protein
MSTTLVPSPPLDHAQTASSTRGVKVLLAAGIAYGVTYVVANDLVAARLSAGYSSIDQTISELSAVGAPARPFLAIVGIIWPLLLAAFGAGVWRAAAAAAVDRRTPLRIMGAVLVAHGLFSSLWYLFPMSQRQDIVAGTTSAHDVGHLAMAAGTVLFIVVELVLGAVALGRWFRIYSIASAVTILVFGAMTSAQVSNIADARATPFVGVYERVNVGSWMLWLAVLAVTLIRLVDQEPTPATERSATGGRGA